MSDLSVSAYVSRGLLSLGDLDLNDHTNFILAGPAPVQGSVNWERKQTSGPHVDGDLTYARRRTNVVESVTFYVKGTDQASLDANLGTIKTAFFQARFTLQIIVGSANHAWDCEASDVSQVLYDTAHVYNLFVPITFAVPRMPIALAGNL